MAISENIICNPEYNARGIYTDPNIQNILTGRTNTKDQYAKQLVTTRHYQDQSGEYYATATCQVINAWNQKGYFAVRDGSDDNCRVYVIDQNGNTSTVNASNTTNYYAIRKEVGGQERYYHQFDSNTPSVSYTTSGSAIDISPTYTNIPLFNSMEDAADYIQTGSWANAVNVEIAAPYADWTVGYTNSNDTVYSLACSVPAFYDPDSDYYGKNEVATINLQALYVIGETLTSFYQTSYPYGQTWQGQLSSIIGQSDMSIANQIAVGAASLLDLDKITLVFSVSIPDDPDPYVLPRGRVVFDHEEVEDYGFLDPITNDTINFKSGVVLDDSDSDIDNPDPEDEESDDITDPSVSDVTGTGLLTKTYVLTPQEAQGVGQFIWGASFIQNIRLLNNSPIENIVSCKLFPFDLTGTAENVQIGNVDTGTASQKIAQNIITHTSNALLIPHFYKLQCDNMEFLDYDPYTKVEIFLPFIGIKELPTDLIMGKNIKLKWIVDLTCGTLETDVLIEYKSGKYCPLYIFNSQCGADIPLTAQNLSAVQAAYIGNAISGGVSLASGNVAGVMQSLAGAAMTQYHSQSSGTPSPGTALQGYLKPYVRITRPDAKIVGSSMDGDDINEPCFMYRRLMGSPLYQVKNLGSLMGYTEIENPQIVIPCALGVEIDEVNRLLSEGIILKYPDVIGA